jgi:hypothetical protein
MAEDIMVMMKKAALEEQVREEEAERRAEEAVRRAAELKPTFRKWFCSVVGSIKRRLRPTKRAPGAGLAIEKTEKTERCPDIAEEPESHSPMKVLEPRVAPEPIDLYVSLFVDSYGPSNIFLVLRQQLNPPSASFVPSHFLIATSTFFILLGSRDQKDIVSGYVCQMI